GPAFLHEGRALGGRRGVLEKFEALAVGARLHDFEFFQRRPGIVDEAAGEGFAVRRRVVGGDFEPPRKEISRPACADGPGADHRDAFWHASLRDLYGGPTTASPPARFQFIPADAALSCLSTPS